MIGFYRHPLTEGQKAEAPRPAMKEAAAAAPPARAPRPPSPPQALQVRGSHSVARSAACLLFYVSGRYGRRAATTQPIPMAVNTTPKKPETTTT